MSAATQIVAAKHRRWRDGLLRTYAGTSHSSTCQIPPFSPVHFARTRAQAGPTGAMRSVAPERTSRHSPNPGVFAAKDRVSDRLGQGLIVHAARIEAAKR